MRRGPSVQFGISAKLKHDTDNLLNLGCYPELALDEWEKMPESEQQLATKMRWCRVMHKGHIGWVYARYLREH